MLTDLSLGRKMHTLRRSCMTLLLWKVSLFIVLWAGQGAGWVRWVLSNFSGSQHSKANFSSSSYGQQKHRGAPQCRFHSCRKSAGRPENKGEREPVKRREASGTQPFSQAQGNRTEHVQLRQPYSVQTHSVNCLHARFAHRHERTDTARAWAFTDGPSTVSSRQWILTEEFPVHQGGDKNSTNKSLSKTAEL